MQLHLNQYQYLLERVPGLLWITDKDLFINMMTGSFLRDNDLPGDKAIGMNVRDMVCPENEVDIVGLYEKALQGESALFEYRFSHWFLAIKVEPFYDDSGSIIGTIGTARDITDQKAADIALDDTEKKYRDLFDKAVDVLFIVDGQGRFVTVNLAAEQLLEITRDELIGRSIYEFIPAPSREEVRQIIMQQINDQSVKQFEMQWLRADNSLIYLEVRSGVIKQDGTIIGIQGIARDVTDRKRIQAELQASEERFRTLAENTSACIYIHKGDHLAYINPAMEKVTGYSKEELLSIDPYDLIHPDYRETVLEKGRALQMGSRGVGTSEIMTINRSGKPVWVELTAIPFIYEGEIAILGSAFDITNRKEAEQALQESAARLKALTEASFEGIIISEKGICLEANQQIADLMGYTVAEMLGEQVFDYMTIEATEVVRRNLVEQYNLPYEVTLTKKDGSPVLVEVQNRFIPYQGRTAMASAIRDLSEHQRARHELEQKDKYLQTLFYNSPDGIAFCDLTLRIIDVNPRFVELFGYQPEECMGRLLSDIIVPQELLGDYAKHVQTTEANETLNMETIRKTKEGQLLDVLVKVIPIRGMGAYAMYSDISERKSTELTIKRQMQELEGKNAEMERFTYTVSHDLRSPLITIKGFSTMMLDDIRQGRNDRAAEDIQRVIKAADRMDELLKDLLELSRIGRIVKPFSWVDMSSLVHTVVELLEGVLNQNRVKVRISSTLPAIWGDESRLQEVLQNLVENAVKFMGDQPHPTIELGHYPGKEEDVFYVRDNGMGIDVQYQDKIFGLFDKLDQRSEGTGIGLALAKRIVELHGGRIWVESKGLGYGTTFLFAVPRAHQELN